MTAQEMREMLDAPLPAEAIRPHPSKKFLSTINSIYVTERLNDVFGVGRWGTTSEIIENADSMVVLKVHFWAHSPVDDGDMVKLEAYGGNDNDDRGDAYKGAMTDALTKIGSFLGIGADVWKNKAPTSRSGASDSGAQVTRNGTQPRAADSDLPWLNVTDRKGQMTPKGEDICRLIKAGQVTLDELKAKYRINKQTEQRLESLQNESKPVGDRRDSGASTQAYQDITDELPF